MGLLSGKNLTDKEFLEKWTIDKFLSKYSNFLGENVCILNGMNTIEFWQGIDLLLYPVGYRIVSTFQEESYRGITFVLEKPSS